MDHFVVGIGRDEFDPFWFVCLRLEEVLVLIHSSFAFHFPRVMRERQLAHDTDRAAEAFLHHGGGAG